jgi:hypothetical protein
MSEFPPNCARSISRTVGMTVTEAITATPFEYIDWMSRQVVAVYEDEREGWLENQNSLCRRGTQLALQLDEVSRGPTDRPPRREIGSDRLDVELALLACHWPGTAVLEPNKRGRTSKMRPRSGGAGRR